MAKIYSRKSTNGVPNLRKQSLSAHSKTEFSNISQLSNRTIQRLLIQRNYSGISELDDITAEKVNNERGSGQTLDTKFQQKMSRAMRTDFGNVRIHANKDSSDLSEQLGAKAFTTGQDIYFRDGEYNPHTSNGQELIAHELTHVVQQGSGAVPSSGSGMTVNPPGDQFEQEADAVAKQVTTMDSAPTASTADVQRKAVPDDELQRQPVQRQEGEDDEMAPMNALPDDEIQTKLVQRQEGEDEELANMEELPEDDEALAQMQAMPDDELAEDA